MAVIFSRIAVNRQILNKVRHHSIVWKTAKCRCMFAVSWALEKGDWWKDKDEETAKFMSWQWKKKSGEFVRTGVYIGRLAIVWQKRPKGDGPTE